MHFVSGLDGAIVTLATRSALRQTLVEEIEARHFKIWQEYAIEICRYPRLSLIHNRSKRRNPKRLSVLDL